MGWNSLFLAKVGRFSTNLVRVCPRFCDSVDEVAMVAALPFSIQRRAQKRSFRTRPFADIKVLAQSEGG